MRILILFLAFCSTFAFRKSIPERHAQTIPAQEEQSDTLIPWKKDRKLTWNDFEATPDSLSTYKAITSTYIRFKKVTFTVDLVEYDLLCFFDKNKSWSKNKKSSALLKHEQLHFDIAELAMRKARKRFLEHTLDSLKGVNAMILANLNQTDTERLALDEQYDRETNHGTIAKKQQEWETKIANELKKYEKYSSTKVVIKRVVKP